jgi:hypothetical protein
MRRFVRQVAFCIAPARADPPGLPILLPCTGIQESMRMFIQQYLRIAVLCAVSLGAAAPAVAQQDSLAAGLTQLASSVESQLALQQRCVARAERLQQELLALQSAAPVNTAAVAETQSLIDAARKCVDSRASRANTLAAQLLQGQTDLAATTGADAGQIAAQVEQLRAAERERFAVEAEITRTENQLARLNLDPLANASRISAREDTLLALRARLSDTRREITTIGSALQSIEIAAAEAAAAAASAVLSWSIPTTRENGTPLLPGDIGGYEIYMLSESTGESVVIVLRDPFAVRHTVDALPPDTYHFSIAAFDNKGQFSQLSDVVAKVIR